MASDMLFALLLCLHKMLLKSLSEDLLKTEMIKYMQSNLNNKLELGLKKLVLKFGFVKDLIFETAAQICNFFKVCELQQSLYS